MYCLDLLAVRKIRLREHGFIGDDGDSSARLGGPSTERMKPDPNVRTLTREMQNVVAKDRGLHEKVYLESLHFTH
jgi:hypothetical protein